MKKLQSDYLPRLRSPLTEDTTFIIFGLGTQLIEAQGQRMVKPLAFSYGPIFAASNYFRSCTNKKLNCKIIVSGADVGHTELSEAASIADALKQAGVDPAAILIDETSRNSWTNARNTAEILRTFPRSKTVLVQAAPFMKRNLLYLAHFGVKPEPIAAAYLTTNHTNISSAGLAFLSMDVALHEFLGLMRYRLFNALGWNEPPVPVN